MSIGSFSVRNPVLINILMVTLLVLGVFSVVRLPKEQFSEVPFFWANIIVPYPGVSAEDVEETVTVPVENQYRDIENLKRIQSVTSEGLSVVRIEFDDGISEREFDKLFQEVQTRFSKVDLPDGTLQEEIDDFSAADFLPVIEVILSGNVEYDTLNTQAEQLEERLQNVSDVSNIEVVGSRERQILIQADAQKLEALGIPIDSVINTVSQSNTTVPGGTLRTPNREYLLRTIGKLQEPEQFERLIVRTTRSGSVQVSDVATVREIYDTEGTRARFNGVQSINFKISKVSGGDSLTVTGGVKEAVDQFQQELPNGMNITVFNDSTVQIKDSINTLLNNFLLGFILLVIILFLFIGLRNALITAIGIPVTFAITFLLLEYMGESLNTNTLFGLVLVLGLIVDHAIVIIENSYRLQQEGLSRIDAAIEGTNQVVWPVVAASATTIAAFLPLMILPGTIGKFLRVIPLTVSVALFASTFEALVFLPVHFADWASKSKKKTKRFFEVLRSRYQKLLSALYKRRKLTVLVMLIVMIFLLGLTGTVQQDLFSAEDYSLFYIDIEMPAGTPREKTNTIVAQFEEKLLPLIGEGEVLAVNSTIGFAESGTSTTSKSNVAEIIVDLKERDRGRTRSINAIIREVEQLSADIPGPEKVRYRKATTGPPTDPPISFRVQGDNYQRLIDISRAVQQKLGEYPELYNISDNIESGTPELRVRVNQSQAARYGLSTAAVGRYIRSSIDGETATTIFKENEEIDVLVQYNVGSIDSMYQLQQLKIPTPSGNLVPFNSVCTIEESSGIASIKRIDGKREVTIEAEAYNEERIRQINAEIEQFYNQTFAPSDSRTEFLVGGEFAEFNNLLIQILRIFLIGVFLIYIILGTQFRSYGQPFLILFSVPFSFAGVILFLVLSGTPFSTTVMYAGVALAGIAVNDAIVLISFINNLREENYSTFDAVMRASTTRLRPILLTSFTTIAGLIPTAIGIGGRSVVWGPMASTIIFGLIFSTITALLFIPCLYGIFDDTKQFRLRRRQRRIEKRRAKIST
ncbi:MAG: efflux RND transporter permease subunit [bacterium]